MFFIQLLTEGSEGPNTELLDVLLYLLAFFALTILLGWWSANRKRDMVRAEQEPGVLVHVKKEADDLIRIEGIGPKVAKILARAGITTFADLARSEPDNVQVLLDKAGMHMLNPEGWIDQAKLAVKGDWVGFEKLQGELRGGRRKKQS